MICQTGGQGSIGSYSPERVRKRIRPLRAKITRCVEKALLVNPSLSGSRIETKILVKRGRVSRVRVRALDSDLEECVGKVLEKLRFSSRDVTDAPEIDYNFTIGSDEGAKHPTTPAALWLEELIGERLGQPDSPVKICLANELRARPLGYGRVHMRMRIDSTGRVSELDVGGNAETVVQCIREKMTKLAPFPVRPDDDQKFHCSTLYGQAQLPSDAPVLHVTLRKVVFNGERVANGGGEQKPATAIPMLESKLREVALQRRLIPRGLANREEDEARELLVLRVEDDVPPPTSPRNMGQHCLGNRFNLENRPSATNGWRGLAKPC